MSPTPSPAKSLATAAGTLALPQRAHLVGVCGSGMRGLAQLLTDWNWQLSGSDLAEPSQAASLVRRGLTYFQGHHSEHVANDVSLLIYSAAITSDNSERTAARARGIPELSYSEMLGRLMQSRMGVCIAGTHGKSTTTAMTASILEEAGEHPSVLFGADLCQHRTNGWAGSGDLFVVESCEFRRSFLDLSPGAAAILSVEPDHFDCFSTRDELVDAFRQFAERVDPQGFLLTRHEDLAARESARTARAEVLTFGWSEDADWWATDLRRLLIGTRFRLFRRGQYVTEISLGLPGRHNVLNALAAAAMAFELGIAPGQIRSSLNEFRGIRRRFEFLGSWRGVTLIDDYAHHPTAVATTLQAARELFGSRRIWAVFQPHQVSRTVALMPEFAASFAAADQVLLTPIYAARELVTDEPTRLSRELALKAAEYGPMARFVDSLDHALEVLDDELRPGDVLITMGAGDIDRIQHAFTRRFQRDSATRRALGSVHLAEGGRTRAVLPRSA